MAPLIRPAQTDDELREVAAVCDAAFSVPFDAERHRRNIAFHREVEHYLALVDDEVVGSGAACVFDLTLPGGATVEVSGVTEIGVLPTHRRQGVLTAMMDRLLADAAAAGRPAAVLYASEATIYGRFGFAPATRTRRVRVDARRGAFHPGAAVAPGRLLMVAPQERAAVLPAVLRVAARSRSGEVDRSTSMWHLVLDSPPRGRAVEDRLCMVHLDDAARPDGYVLYRLAHDWHSDGPHGVLQVAELVAADPAVELALWRGVLGVDLMEAVEAAVAADTVLEAALVDPRAITTVGDSDGLWVRLLDVPVALGARRYASPGEVVVGVTDPSRPATSGRWRLRVDGDGEAVVEPTGDPAELEMDVASLAAQWLGEVDLDRRARAGRVREHVPGAVRRLGAMFGWSPRPWTTVDF